MDAIKDDGDGKERRELSHCVGNGGALSEYVADDMATHQHQDCDNNGDDEGTRSHHYNYKLGCSWVACAELIAHSYTKK